jgi:thiosulfate reductase cytochrome b subunit
MPKTATMPGAALGEGSFARPAPIHPAYVRITHWINAVAILLMIGSGWEIYNASPLFLFEFPKSITLGGWLAGALLWHFAAMWLLVGNGLVYVLLGLTTRRFRRKWLPLRPADFMRDLRAALTGRLAHGDPTIYNAVQKALYIGVVTATALADLRALPGRSEALLNAVVAN